MLFSSMTFLCVFLPLVIFFYLIVKKELKNPVLLIASMIFYAWGEPKYLAMMLSVILINYFGAILIEKNESSKKPYLILTVLLNLSFLIYFKYFNFLIDNFNNIFHTNHEFLNVIMPIGISFYTFQALSYVIDVYRKDCAAQKDIYKLALYICLFPQLVAGPIVKYHDVIEQIENRDVDFEKVDLGVKRFIIGLSKKMLIANTLGAVADKVFVQSPDAFSHSIAWLGSIAYAFQIYFDFSGYSDMALGLGLIFGFKFLENFNYPYISKSITEFWRRWHISLSTWFKEYVYIPLGGNRCGKIKTYRNLFIVFLLTGIWHGANWTFIVWGIWNGLFIIFEKMISVKDLQEKYAGIYAKTAQHIYCILIFLIGWVIFRADDINYALKYLMNMFGILHLDKANFVYNMSYYVDTIEIITFVAAILCSVPLFSKMLENKNKISMALINNIWLLVLFIFSVSSIAANTYNPFIYFRF